MPGGSSLNILDNKFYSVSLKEEITGVGIRDVPDKRTERHASQTFQEYSRFNCYKWYWDVLWLY